MPSAIRFQRLASFKNDLNPDVVILSDGHGGEAVIWPALGFNCIKWTCKWQGRLLDLVHQDPNLAEEPSPTRSGNPILFPFPNRIRGGKFHWAGNTFKIPPNHGTNAIHGFACRNPWKVVGHGTFNGDAWVTGEYHGFVDNPGTSHLWPADHILRVTCRLRLGRLSFEAEILNPDVNTLPWGLGYHPYFKSVWHEDFIDSPLEIKVPAKSAWELEDCLPTGKVLPLPAEKNLENWKDLKALHLDDVLTELAPGESADAGMIDLGSLRHPGGPTLRVLGDPIFRHVVVYTPGDRESVCIEPYTCVTDAINLRAKGHSLMPHGLIESPLGTHFLAQMVWEIT